MLEKIVKSPYLNLLSGIVLLVMSAFETWDSFGDGSIGAHHGLLVFSVVHILKLLPEIMHGLREIDEGKEGFEAK